MGLKLPEELMFLANSRKPQHTSNVSMAGKLVVISGSTSGVGLSALKRFAAGGANLVMVCRNRAKAEAIRTEIQSEHDVSIDIYVADFASQDDIRRAAGEILEHHAKIDVLINSVGIHSTRRSYTKDGIETVFAVNHLGVFLFTTLLLERIKQSAPARIIQVNSEGHRFNGLRVRDVNFKRRIYTGLRGYGQSKTAQLLTTWEFADQLSGSGVTINAMHPGAVKTNIGSNNGWLYRFFLRHFTWHFLKDVSISGESLYWLASAPELSDTTGKFFNLTIEEVPARHARNRKRGKAVWDLSRQMCHLDSIDNGGDSDEL